MPASVIHCRSVSLATEIRCSSISFSRASAQIALPDQIQRRIAKLLAVAPVARLALKLQSAGDLLRRPAMHDALDHRLAELREPGKFAQLGTPFSRHVIGHHAVVTVEVRHLTILERIAAQLTENG